MKTDALDLTCQILSLRCIPADFHNSSVALAISSLFKTVGEILPAPVLTVLVKHLRLAAKRTESFWAEENGDGARFITKLLTPQSEHTKYAYHGLSLTVM